MGVFQEFFRFRLFLFCIIFYFIYFNLLFSFISFLALIILVFFLYSCIYLFFCRFLVHRKDLVPQGYITGGRQTTTVSQSGPATSGPVAYTSVIQTRTACPSSRPSPGVEGPGGRGRAKKKEAGRPAKDSRSVRNSGEWAGGPTIDANLPDIRK